MGFTSSRVLPVCCHIPQQFENGPQQLSQELPHIGYHQHGDWDPDEAIDDHEDLSQRALWRYIPVAYGCDYSEAEED